MSVALGRLQAALTAATNEVTLAAASINFDFTLVKYEAPKEYHDLGKTLTKKRRDDAEMGPLHITARRLGALFEDVCDPSPALISAYGRRVSEIASATQDESLKAKGTLLEQHAGIDGTSIWAAATSSPAALHVQLLACMLARVFSATEAISIWVELVKERRKELAQRFANGYEEKYASLSAAAQPEILRANLAEWDASARAWLAAADRIKRSKQDQLMLIIANVNIQINNDLTVLSSVIDAWRLAIASMEKLVNGMPQAVNSGPTLLALSAWHLYPDILTVGKDCVQISFQDELIEPGGILTIGLASAGSSSARGVYWSLSLSHLYHYGRPVKRQGVISEYSERLTFHQFGQAVLGCVLGLWESEGGSMLSGIRLLIALQEFAWRASNDQSLFPEERKSASRFRRNNHHWLNLLANAARLWLESDRHKDEVHKLVMLGMRRYDKFYDDTMNPKDRRRPQLLLKQAYFGLASRTTYLDCLKTTEMRISYLRRAAEPSSGPIDTLASGPPSILIRYLSEIAMPAYATVKPVIMEAPTKRRKVDQGRSACMPVHCRWLHHGSSANVHGEVCMDKKDLFNEKFDPGSSFGVWNDTDKKWTSYAMKYGSSTSACICQNLEKPGVDLRPFELETIIESLEKDELSFAAVFNHIDAPKHLDVLDQTLRVLTRLSQLFGVIPLARVSVMSLSRPMTATYWFSYLLSRENITATQGITRSKIVPVFDRPSAFACLAYMIAQLDIIPSQISNVFAMAFEDSIFVDMRVVCDPSETPAPYEMKHVLGNVGKPGVALLAPPLAPMLRQQDPGSWRLISGAVFDGKPEDFFERTTMHLSFTESFQPLYTNGTGGQDCQVHILESVVAVHDSGNWIADLDIVKSLGSELVLRGQFMPVSCDHHHSNAPKSPESGDPAALTSVESWDDVFDMSKGASVVRAHANWVARLALVCVTEMIMKGTRRIAICPSGLCWQCFDAKVFPRSTIYIF